MHVLHMSHLWKKIFFKKATAQDQDQEQEQEQDQKH
jgi:hypothetical protein